MARQTTERELATKLAEVLHNAIDGAVALVAIGERAVLAGSLSPEQEATMLGVVEMLERWETWNRTELPVGLARARAVVAKMRGLG
jgi:hypothetical protein